MIYVIRVSLNFLHLKINPFTIVTIHLLYDYYNYFFTSINIPHGRWSVRILIKTLENSLLSQETRNSERGVRLEVNGKSTLR